MRRAVTGCPPRGVLGAGTTAAGNPRQAPRRRARARLGDTVRQPGHHVEAGHPLVLPAGPPPAGRGRSASPPGRRRRRARPCQQTRRGRSPIRGPAAGRGRAAEDGVGSLRAAGWGRAGRARPRRRGTLRRSVRALRVAGGCRTFRGVGVGFQQLAELAARRRSTSAPAWRSTVAVAPSKVKA